MSTPANSLSRRDFLRLFTRNAAQSASEAVSALVPPPSGSRRERRRARLTQAAPPGDPAEPQALCARCCVPFPAAADSAYCADCRAQEARSLSLLAGFPPERAE